MQNLAVISAPKEKSEILSVNAPGTKSLQKKNVSSGFSEMLSEISSAMEKKDVTESTVQKESPAADRKVKKDVSGEESRKEVSSEKERSISRKADFSDDGKVQDTVEKEVSQNASFFVESVLPASDTSDVIPDSENLMPEMSVNNTDVSEDEGLNLSSAQIDFLYKTKKTDDFESLIDNAEDFVAGDRTQELLNTAQNLSLENPDKFLVMAEQVNENVMASEISEESLMPFNLNAADDKAAEDEDVLAEGLKTGVQKKDGVFTVFDNRSNDEKAAALEEASPLKIKVSEKDSSSVDMTLNLEQQHAAQNITSSTSQAAAADGSTFQQMLSQTIQHNAPEFVKAGNIVLRDNSNGSINMILKPESLGNVKVSLQLSDKVITGQIVVATKEAFEAFKENLDTLRQAFQQSGFENAQFELSFADNSQSGAFAGQQNPQQQMNHFLSNRAYSRFVPVENDSSSTDSRYYDTGDSRVDVVA
ncbi:MAG: flagellar hook-length control protein FliK [Treponema sp.]|nr:flagellar hook-length control protein FliK [Treponema sp.]